MSFQLIDKIKEFIFFSGLDEGFSEFFHFFFSFRVSGPSDGADDPVSWLSVNPDTFSQLEVDSFGAVFVFSGGFTNEHGVFIIVMKTCYLKEKM